MILGGLPVDIADILQYQKNLLFLTQMTIVYYYTLKIKIKYDY